MAYVAIYILLLLFFPHESGVSDTVKDTSYVRLGIKKMYKQEIIFLFTR